MATNPLIRYKHVRVLGLLSRECQTLLGPICFGEKMCLVLNVMTQLALNKRHKMPTTDKGEMQDFPLNIPLNILSDMRNRPILQSSIRHKSGFCTANAWQ